VFAAGLGSHGSRRGPDTGCEQHAAPADETPVLEARVEEQGASLQVRIGEISTVSAELEEAQSRADSARARQRPRRADQEP
jgi:hypothetical protein